MDACDAAQRWASTWARAWPAADVDAMAELYAEHAMFHSHPFREQRAPGAYAAWAFSQQASAQCRFGEPIAAGDRAVVDWYAVVTGLDGSEETLAGVSLLRFDAAGRVIEQRDAWASAPGHVELPAWAP